MIIIRSVIFNCLLISTIIIIGILALPLLVGPRRWVCRVRDCWIKFVIFLLRIIVGLDYRVEGWEGQSVNRVLVASKHQSAWETLALHLIFFDPAIVLKRELLRLPILGWFIAKVGMVPIDRSGGGVALKTMLMAARKWSDAGRPIIIFPQGTRVAIDESIKYHSGVFAVYKALNIPVVPVALNSGRFWPRQAFVKRPGVITVKLLDVIKPGLNRQEFMSTLESSIETATKELEG
ncbi:MAG: 1-acyl-sn-glycerol-3-phosphate acyltransferase [Rhodospirillaceae bacterium]|nr:1-acyl-sn-glycerol-3-phosphate acyltransferase [Rhodospirillaceae bacterium]